MNVINKPVWSEGLFMRPHHFQQLERYIESALDQRVKQIDAFQYGFLALAIDEQALQLGRIALETATGAFEDGQLFHIPGNAQQPAALEVDQGKTGKIFGLCSPLPTYGQAEITLASDGFDQFGNQRVVSASEIPTRFNATETEAWDATVKDKGFEKIHVANLTCLLKWQEEDVSSYTFLPMGRILDVKAEGAVTLDPNFIPTSLQVGASAALARMADNFSGIIEQQSRGLANRISRPGQSGVADVSDFLKLVSLNRIGTEFKVLGQVGGIHPRELFRVIATAVGELSSYAKSIDNQPHNDRLPPELTPYDHRLPSMCFAALTNAMNSLLSQQTEGAAVPVALRKSGANGFSALIEGMEYFSNRDLILAVKADLSESVLKDSFPAQAKMGPKEEMRNLIAYQVPGIRLIHLAVVPRQLPFHAGFLYFRVERGTALWNTMLKSQQLELYVGGKFPGLELELWAVRG